MFFPYKYVRASSASAYKTYLFCMLLSSARINLKTSRNLYKNDSFLNEWLTTLEPIDFNNKWALNGVFGAHPTPRPPSLHPPSPTHHKESVIDLNVSKHRDFLWDKKELLWQNIGFCDKTKGWMCQSTELLWKNIGVFWQNTGFFAAKHRIFCNKSQGFLRQNTVLFLFFYSFLFIAAIKWEEGEERECSGGL